MALIQTTFLFGVLLNACIALASNDWRLKRIAFLFLLTWIISAGSFQGAGLPNWLYEIPVSFALLVLLLRMQHRRAGESHVERYIFFVLIAEFFILTNHIVLLFFPVYAQVSATVDLLFGFEIALVSSIGLVKISERIAARRKQTPEVSDEYLPRWITAGRKIPKENSIIYRGIYRLVTGKPVKQRVKKD